MLLVAVLLLAFTADGLAADPVRIRVATGDPAGTYHHFGEDIAELARPQGFDVQVVSTNGALQNLYELYDRRSIQLAITQGDVLQFLARFGDAEARRALQEVEVAMPLYVEELHVLARDDVSDVRDLAGRRIAIGEPGSGTAITAEVTLELAQVSPEAVFRVGGADALEALRNREIDAMFFVGGRPLKLLSESVTAADGVHLVPVLSEALQQIYGEPVTIPAGTYSWQDQAVPTVGVISALMTLHYAPQEADCEHVLRVTGLIRDGLDKLRADGHPKWGEVDLAFPVAAENRAVCSALWSP